MANTLENYPNLIRFQKPYQTGIANIIRILLFLAKLLSESKFSFFCIDHAEKLINLIEVISIYSEIARKCKIEVEANYSEILKNL